MTTPSDTPTPPTDSTSTSATSSASPADARLLAPSPAPGAPRLPSLRASAMLAAGMLALGVAAGAAIGPAPSPSLANSSLPALLGSLARIATTRAAPSTTAAVQPPPVVSAATPTRKKRPRAGKSASAQETSSTTTTTSTSETTTPAATTPTSTGKAKTKTTTLPPITKVWLIELTGATFSEAATQPSAAPYIDSQAIPAGTLLSGWSGLDGGAFANETALLANEPPLTDVPPVLDTIVQPPCPEGAAAASCAAETPGALTAADEFLEASIPAITSTAAFRESGLIVITFASVASATATGLPAGAATATLTAQPPAGVLLISPFASVGARSSTAFNPTSPKRSLEKLLRR